MKRMLIDAAHPEETRVAVLDGNQLEEFDVESASRKQLKGNIYLAKVTRVEPSLQAAFVDYGGNRHGFLAFNEIHPDYYQIPVADRERLLAEQAEEDEAEEEAERQAEEREEAALAARGEHDGELAGEEHEGEPEDQHAEGDTNGDAQPQTEFQAEFHDHHAEGEVIPPIDGDAGTLIEPTEDDEPRVTIMAEAMPAPESFQGPIIDHEIDHEGDGETTAIAETSETAGESAEASEGVDGDDEGPEPTGSIEHVEPAGPVKPLETLGGDDVDEVAERRRPPQRAMRRYKIQEVIKRRQILLVQVVKEERGNKGAALTTYLSLAGRYCVLMPNTGKGGGISRKIGGGQDRKRLKSIISDLEVPRGMAMIVRTAGADRGKAEIKRDYDYLLRLWNDIRTLTLASTAPALIHGEASIINRAIRDLYTRDIEEVIVEGDDAYRVSKDLMKMLIPSHAKKVQHYKDDNVPLFSRYQIEHQLESMNSPTVQLKSGGYIVMNATEALVAIDVNSGRATRGRNIEETALRTNTEAATEIARQLRLRDLAGLIVIDFIDMDHSRNQQAVERRLKEAMRRDRARIQIGRISPFGLLELSRQRLRPSLAETVTDICPHCGGTGILRSTESTALHVLRGVEEEAMKRRAAELTVAVSSGVALYLLNHKRSHLLELEKKFDVRILVTGDDSLIPPKYTIERSQPLHHEVDEGEERSERQDRNERRDRDDRHERRDRDEQRADSEQRRDHADGEQHDGGEEGGRRRRRRRGRRRGHGDARSDETRDTQHTAPRDSDDEDDFEGADTTTHDSDNDYAHNIDAAADGDNLPALSDGEDHQDDNQGEHREGRRRRGRRGGRGRNRNRRDDNRPDQQQHAAEGDAPMGHEGENDGEETNVDATGAQQDQSGEGAGRRRRRIRRRGRGPRADGMNEETAEGANDGESAPDVTPDDIAASATAAEPTLWAASDHDEAQPAANVAEPTQIETSSEPSPAASYTAPETVTEAEPETASEPAPQSDEAAPAPAPKVEEEAPAGPPRRGWWQRLVE